MASEIPDPDALLGIYLQDHMAGATGGLKLAQRTAASNRGTELGAFLTRLEREIAEDRDSLRMVMGHLEATRSPVKEAAVFVGERVARLKLNGMWSGYSPLSRLVELEGLCTGVETKRNLWRSLQTVLDEGRLPDHIDLDVLIDRASRQRDELEEHRLQAARESLSGVVGG